ncbi:MAG: alpha/beta hydrolase [Candidatus Omnitrophica bacterium]|nr:alpha/beta hydrolase [Candidatus Omnitrophota bacterium]
MPSYKSEFKLVKKGFKDILVLVPGWAADYRIFSRLELNYDYLYPRHSYPADFVNSLCAYLKNNSIQKVSLFGWSMGAFLAYDFSILNPELVDALYLIGIRKRYDHSALKEVADNLRKNKRAFLYKFYQDCFSQSDQDSYLWFKRHLMHDYLNDITEETLIYGLDYLGTSQLDPQNLKSIKKVKIYHGRQDKIAPFSELLKIKQDAPFAEFVVFPGLGHIPFISPSFQERFYG